MGTEPRRDGAEQRRRRVEKMGEDHGRATVLSMSRVVKEGWAGSVGRDGGAVRATVGREGTGAGER